MECSLHERGFHARFIAILQIIYQWERLAYFSNRIAITSDLANRWQHVNWCYIVLTQLLVDLIHWTKRQKKTITNLISSKTKADNCHSKPTLYIMLGSDSHYPRCFHQKQQPWKNMCHQLTKNDKLLRSNRFHLNMSQGINYWRKGDQHVQPHPRLY
jgi:hypothetical protein